MSINILLSTILEHSNYFWVFSNATSSAFLKVLNALSLETRHPTAESMSDNEGKDQIFDAFVANYSYPKHLLLTKLNSNSIDGLRYTSIMFFDFFYERYSFAGSSAVYSLSFPSVHPLSPFLLHLRPTKQTASQSSVKRFSVKKNINFTNEKGFKRFKRRFS